MVTNIAHDREGGRAAFLEAMSRLASAVSIITTDGPEGRAGVTVSSLVSVSADTPLPTILVCIHKSSAACSAILGNGVFCANILRHDQAHIADTFAGRKTLAGGEKFASASWADGLSGATRLIDPLATFDCRITHSKLIGLHHVIFGEVQSLVIGNHDQPLIYVNRGYKTAVPLAVTPDIVTAKVA